MRKLVLIGGGELYETKEIDEEIVKMTNKDKPIFLFIGLASDYADSKYDAIKVIYRGLGCETMYLKKKNIINNPHIVEEKIAKADIIYMGGGDTVKLVDTIKDYQIDKLLLEASNRGCVIAGISAGAIAIARAGLSDYLILKSEDSKYAFVSGLSLTNLDICPHGNNSKRIEDLQLLIKNTKKKVLILDDGVAVKVEGNNLSIIKSIKTARGRFAYYKNDTYCEEEFI